jgi:hypothetical protein
MSLPTYDYLDGNAAAGELSSIFAPDVSRLRGSARIAAQKSLLLMHTCTCKILVSWHGAQSANTCSFALSALGTACFLTCVA